MGLRRLHDVLERQPLCSSTLSRGVRVEVTTRHLSEAKGAWDFVYRFRLTNVEEGPVQLLRRNLVFRNANGEEKSVLNQPGVVGQVPVLERGQTFEYFSGVPLGTPRGSFHGHFVFVDLTTSTEFSAVFGPVLFLHPTVPLGERPSVATRIEDDERV